MKEILTRDNSITFFNKEFKENLHPESGAIESVYKRYINHLSLKDNIRVLDIGFGIGYISLIILSKVNATFDLIILDAFSPIKNKELYSIDFMKELKKRMNKDSILITYSSNPIVR